MSTGSAVALALLLAACTTPAVGHRMASERPRAPSTTPVRRRVQPHLEVSRSRFSLPVAVQREVAVADGSGVLVAGGLDGSGSSTAGVYRVPSGAGPVTRVGTMGAPFHDAAAALLGGRLVVFGGGITAGTDLVQAFGGSVPGRLPTPISDVSAAVAGRSVVLVGGYDGVRFLSTVLVTRDARTFRRLASLPRGLRYAAVTGVGDAVIVAGGLSAAGPVATILRIGVPDGSVRAIGRLPEPLAHAAAVTLGGDVYVLGGEDASGRTIRSIERIDPRTGEVQRISGLPGSVADAAAVAVGSHTGLLIGGRRGPQGHDVALSTILELRLVR
ncbi:MAG: hypothetical protein ACJ77A_08240 [Actinomycetota bacterium]